MKQHGGSKPQSCGQKAWRRTKPTERPTPNGQASRSRPCSRSATRAKHKLALKITFVRKRIPDRERAPNAADPGERRRPSTRQLQTFEGAGRFAHMETSIVDPVISVGRSRDRHTAWTSIRPTARQMSAR